MAFAITQAPSTIFILFIAVGLSLALPYLILLARPGMLTRIPRSGAWLWRVQQVLGIILLAGATFFATTALGPLISVFLWSAWTAVLTFWLLTRYGSAPGLVRAWCLWRCWSRF